MDDKHNQLEAGLSVCDGNLAFDRWRAGVFGHPRTGATRDGQSGGPPLDFDRPHNGQVVAHIDVLGRYPPDIARIRISDDLTLKVGSNPASFTAGHQQFNASAPQGPSFPLAPGTAYLFEAWDSKGRVQRNRFTL